jgi:hypothetical protein
VKKLFAALMCVLLAGALIGRGQLVAAGVRQGLGVCTDILLPSLFPFMVLSGFAALSGLGRLMAVPLRPLTRGLLRLPDELGALFFLSMVGGFVTGAQTLASMVRHNRIDAGDAARILPCCVGPGPAFAVLAVGEMMFGSRRIGWLLLAAHTLSTLCVAAVLCRRAGFSTAGIEKPMGFSRALIEAVSGASAGMLKVFAYVILFFAASALLTPQTGAGQAFAALSGIFEVTAGCAAAAGLGGPSGLLLAAFFLSFSGLSVIFQVTAIAHDAGIGTAGLPIVRAAAGLLTALFAGILIHTGRIALTASSAAQSPAAVWSVNRLLGAVCLAAMAVMVLYSPGESANRA